MNNRALKIVILFFLFALIVQYGWKLFQKLDYNRQVFETDIYMHIPKNAKSIMNFTRNHHFGEYFEVDTSNVKLLAPIQDHITYPLVIAKFDQGEDLILMKATRDQENEIKEIFKKIIAPYHPPSIKKYKDAELFFYSLPNNEFAIAAFHKGLFVTSKDYTLVEQFVNNEDSLNFFSQNNAQAMHYINRLRGNTPVSFFTSQDSTTFALTYTKKDSVLYLTGEYFGKLQNDTLKLSYNEMNSMLMLEQHYTDSIHWDDRNRVQIWINKLRE